MRTILLVMTVMMAIVTGVTDVRATDDQRSIQSEISEGMKHFKEGLEALKTTVDFSGSQI